MKAPLFSIKTAADMLLKMDQTPESLKLLESISHSSQMIYCQVGYLLDKNLIENNSFRPIIKEFELESALQNIIDVMQIQAKLQENVIKLLNIEVMPVIIYTDYARLQ